MKNPRLYFNFFMVAAYLFMGVLVLQNQVLNHYSKYARIGIALAFILYGLFRLYATIQTIRNENE